MPCKIIEQLIEESQTRTLTKQELSEMKNHVTHCDTCAEILKQNSILTNLIQDSSHIDDSYIIPQQIMRTRVEAQLQSTQTKKIYLSIFKKPVLISLLTVLIISIWYQNYKIHNITPIPYEYSVALDGLSPELAIQDNKLCDLLYSIGLPEASIDIIGCDTTCKLVIFDLKTQREAEKVVQILSSIDENLLKTNIIKVKLHI